MQIFHSEPVIFPSSILKVAFIKKQRVLLSKKYIDTKQSNKKNNQNSKDKRQYYNMK